MKQFRLESIPKSSIIRAQFAYLWLNRKVLIILMYPIWWRIFVSAILCADHTCLPASFNSFCTVYFSFQPELYHRAWHDMPDARLMSIYIYGVLENYWISFLHIFRTIWDKYFVAERFKETKLFFTKWDSIMNFKWITNLLILYNF